MPRTYEVCGVEVEAIRDDLLATYYQKLVDVKVRIGLMFAYAGRGDDGEPTGPAIKVHGAPAAAKIKINSLIDRIEGKPDATITIDGDAWKEYSETRKRALLHHEIEHLVLVLDDEGHPQADDAGRPKIKNRPDDFAITGFYSIAERYGMDAIEVENVHRASEQFSQLCLWSDLGWQPK